MEVDVLAGEVSRAANRDSGSRVNASVALADAKPPAKGIAASLAGGRSDGNERTRHRSVLQRGGRMVKEPASQGMQSDSPTKANKWREKPNRLKS